MSETAPVPKTRPGSIDAPKDTGPQQFPFDAFEFDDASQVSPNPSIDLKTGWNFVVNSDASVAGTMYLSGSTVVGNGGATIRKLTVSTSAASGTPADGDIWLQRET